MADQAGETGNLARRLNALFLTVGQQAGTEPGYQVVVDTMASDGGPSISSTYLYMLRTGRRDNPRVDVVRALAEYFHVPMSYLLDTEQEDRGAEQWTLYRALQQAELLPLVRQLQMLSPASREALRLLLDRLAPSDAAESGRTSA